MAPRRQRGDCTTMYVQREASSRINLPGVREQEIARFLSRPRRPLAALLNRSRLEVLDTELYGYSSRPFQIATWCIQPRLRLQACWDSCLLRIECLECNVDGLGDWQRLVRFGFSAELVPEHEGCVATVRANLNLDPGGPLELIPEVLRNRLADQALGQAVARMDKRCQNGLRAKMIAFANPGEGEIGLSGSQAV